MCDIVKNPVFSDLNQNLRPLFDSNMGIVTIEKWSSNIILTTKMVKNGCFSVFKPIKRV
jgi:hypothetical protein